MMNSIVHEIIDGKYRASVTIHRINGVFSHRARFHIEHSTRAGKCRTQKSFDRYDLPGLFAVMSRAYAWMLEADRNALKEHCISKTHPGS